MKGIVIYEGKYGATAQYASWLADALYLRVVNADRQSTSNLAQFDYVIVGSPVYMGKLMIKDWLEANEWVLLNKKLFLFIVSSASPDDKARQENVLKNNLPEALANIVQVFFLQGRVVINKLSLKDRLIVRFGAMMEKDPEKKALMRRGFDGVKKENITDLVKNVLKFSTAEEVLI